MSGEQSWRWCGDARLEHLAVCPDTKVTELDQSTGEALVECPHGISVRSEITGL